MSPGGTLRASSVLRAALSLVVARPFANVALGSAVVVSLVSVCCGLGLLTTPWFMCELFALQLSQLRDRPVPRRLSWVWAAGVQMAAVLLVSLVGSLAILGLSADLPGALDVPGLSGLAGVPGLSAAGAPQPATLTQIMQSGGFYALLEIGRAHV